MTAIRDIGKCTQGGFIKGSRKKEIKKGAGLWQRFYVKGVVSLSRFTVGERNALIWPSHLPGGEEVRRQRRHYFLVQVDYKEKYRSRRERTRKFCAYCRACRKRFAKKNQMWRLLTGCLWYSQKRLRRYLKLDIRHNTEIIWKGIVIEVQVNIAKLVTITHFQKCLVGATNYIKCN